MSRFFSHRTRKSTQLIGNTNDNSSIKARREWLSYDLNEPVFITSVTVYASGYELYHEMEISYVDNFTGSTIDSSTRFDGESFTFIVNRFVNGFGIRPSEPFFKSSSVRSIQVKGLEQKYFFEVISIYTNLGAEKSKIEANLQSYMAAATASYNAARQNEEKIRDQETLIDENTSAIQELETRVAVLSEISNELDKKNAIAISVEKERNERLSAIDLDIDKLTANRKSISNDITDRENYLAEIKSNINLFPTEIAGYVKQGTSNIRLYSFLCAIPLALISLVTYRLFSNSEQLLNFFLENRSIGILDFLISRAPYVIVSFAILLICYSVLFRLVSEIIAINRRRQDLYKISIIATDVSYASQDDLNLTEEQRYNLRTETKIEMLKEHLKFHISEDYSYAPSKDHAGLILSVLSKRSPKIIDEAADGAAG